MAKHGVGQQTLQEADKFIKASKNYELLTMEE